MNRYIDAEPLEAEQYKGFNRVSETDWQKGYWSGIDEMCDKIKEQPTADVVEVVRCKDCIYRWFNGVNLHTCVRDTANGEPIVNLGDFCSYGKKVE